MLIQANALTKAMTDYDWLFPAAECVHIASFALAIGTIALADLSLLGVGLRRNAAAQIARGTALWTLTGLVLIIFSGFLLFASDPDMYLRNSAFVTKIVCLAFAIVYHWLAVGIRLTMLLHHAHRQRNQAGEELPKDSINERIAPGSQRIRKSVLNLESD